VIIVLSGSLWVMHHLNGNMMPGVHDMEEMLKAAP
jgi:cytochrome o ubiquinol oxidase operon protein cyoD